jgi:hypothetical protein
VKNADDQQLQLIILHHQHLVFCQCTWFRDQTVKAAAIEDLAWFFI